MAQLVRSARTSLVLIDNYVAENTLHLFSKKERGVSLTLYSQQFQAAFLADAALFNSQYGGLICESLATAYDRFLIIDGQQLYHFGASLKDLGKKWFAFSRMDSLAESLLQQLNGGK